MGIKIPAVDVKAGLFIHFYHFAQSHMGAVVSAFVFIATGCTIIAKAAEFVFDAACTQTCFAINATGRIKTCYNAAPVISSIAVAAYCCTVCAFVMCVVVGMSVFKINPSMPVAILHGCFLGHTGNNIVGIGFNKRTCVIA